MKRERQITNNKNIRKMKKQFLTLLMLSVCMSIFAQSPHNILREYKNNDGVVSLKFDGDIMGLLNSKDGKEIKSELEYMDIIIFKEGTDMTDSDQKSLHKALVDDNYEILINAKDGKNRVKVMGQDQGDTISKVFINADTEKANIYVVVAGKIYFDELQNLNLDKIDNIFD